MNRKQLMIAGGIFSCTVLIYCVMFGPFVYALVLARHYDLVPYWMEKPWTVVFRPHLWVMYESESYNSYINWWGSLVSDSRPTDWNKFRHNYERRFGQEH